MTFYLLCTLYVFVILFFAKNIPIKLFFAAIVTLLISFLMLVIYEGITGYSKMIAHQNHDYQMIFLRGFFEEAAKVIAVLIMAKAMRLTTQFTLKLGVIFGVILSIYENYFFLKEMYNTFFFAVFHLNSQSLVSIHLYINELDFMTSLFIGWSQIGRILLHLVLITMTLIFWKMRKYGFCILFPILHGLNNATSGYLYQYFQN